MKFTSREMLKTYLQTLLAAIESDRYENGYVSGQLSFPEQGLPTFYAKATLVDPFNDIEFELTVKDHHLIKLGPFEVKNEYGR